MLIDNHNVAPSKQRLPSAGPFKMGWTRDSAAWTGCRTNDRRGPRGYTSRFWVEKGGGKYRKNLSLFLAESYGPELKPRLHLTKAISISGAPYPPSHPRTLTWQRLGCTQTSRLISRCRDQKFVVHRKILVQLLQTTAWRLKSRLFGAALETICCLCSMSFALHREQSLSWNSQPVT